MELKDLKLINNGGIPEQEQRLEDKVASTAIPLEGSTGKSTLADRKAIHNLPKFEVGKPGPVQITGLGGGTTNNFNFSGRTSAAAQLGKGLTPDASKAIKSLPTGPSGGGGGGLGKAIGGLGDVAGSAVSNLGGAIDFVGGIASAGQFNMTADDALKDAGTSSGNIGGVGYTRQNDVDSAQISAQTSAENSANTVGLMGKGASLGASVGSVAGPVGGLIGGAVGAIGGLVGGLLGGAARKRKMRRMIAEAKDKAFRQNDYARSGALTSAMQQQYAQEFGDTESQSLYGFADGLAQTPFGFTSGKLQNAYGSNGEIAVQRGPFGNILAATKLGHGRDNKDTVPIVVDNNTEIYTNKKVNIAPGIEVRPSEYFEKTGDADGANYMTAMNIQKKKYKNGKLPGFKWGLPEWTNFGVNTIGTIGSLVDAHNIENEPLSNPNTKKTNPFADIALKTMADIKYNNYQAYNDIWDTYYKHTHQVDNNNNLSAAQRAVMNYAGYKDAMDSMAKINQYAQEANNKYGQAFAQMAAQLGEDQANRDQKAAMFDYEAYNQAHGARRLMASQRKADAMNYLNNWAKGLTDMHMWRRMMDNYDREFEANHPESTSTNAPKVSLDPNGLFRKANFAGTKSVLPDKLSSTPVSQQLIDMFTAETPQDRVRKMKRQSIPKSWTSPTDKSFMNITGVKKQPVYAGGSEFNLFRNMTGFPNWESFMYYAPSPFKRR